MLLLILNFFHLRMWAEKSFFSSSGTVAPPSHLKITSDPLFLKSRLFPPLASETLAAKLRLEENIYNPRAPLL